MRPTRPISFALMIAASAVGFTARTPEANLFPATAGTSWTLRVSVPGQPKTVDQDITVVSSTAAGGATTAVFQYLSGGRETQKETYLITSKDVSRVRSGPGGGNVIEPPLPIIKYPMTVGKSWNWKGTIAVGQASTPGTKFDGEAKLTVGAHEKVKTEGGTFEAFRVDLSLTVMAGAQKQELSNSYWFAPGVGMVKQVAQFSAGKVEGNLVKYKIK